MRLTYKGRPVDRVTGDTLPDFAPEALRDIEDLLPQPQDWSLDGEGYLNMGSNYGSYYSGLSLGHRGHNLSDEEARLYICLLYTSPSHSRAPRTPHLARPPLRPRSGLWPPLGGGPSRTQKSS